MNFKYFSIAVFISFCTVLFAQTNSIKIGSGPDTLVAGQAIEYRSNFSTSESDSIVEWSWQIIALIDTFNIPLNVFEVTAFNNGSSFSVEVDHIPLWSSACSDCEWVSDLSNNYIIRRCKGFIIVSAVDNKGHTYSDIKEISMYYNTGEQCIGLGCNSDEIYFSQAPKNLQLNSTFNYVAFFDDGNGSGSFIENWNWKAKLLHTKGIYILDEDSIKSLNTCTWDLIIDQLPTDFDWIHIDSSRVFGFMELSAEDNESIRFYDTESFYFNKLITVIEKDKPKIQVSDVKLFQNYPNPFNPNTKIEFKLNKIERVELSIFNIQGKLILKLLNEKKSVGKHSVVFDAGNLAAGLYFYQIKAGSFIQNRKMLLIK